MRILFILVVLFQIASGGEEKVQRAGIEYRIWRVKPDRVRVIWLGKDKKPLRTFQAVNRALTDSGEKPVMFMNGGIFEPGGIPSGLLIQNGKTLNPLNRKDGNGNFFLKPNGVFFLTEDGAQIVDASAFDANRNGIRYAVQSGPLLLKNGQTHAAFRKQSESRLLRNGVGVDHEGNVILAISRSDSPKSPNFYEFADLFRSLGCENALFLDGVISQMKQADDLQKSTDLFGSIIAVVE
ncbi:phosphodiester glycosidase family protein [Luteolibacter pohnpeiensis]|uniref:Phosphodiester glycosidase family protein n=1 Tax=Luteolibacter pohnpeiensis TaxID=454153 RepID=A0A934VXJ6_9BACT|nr:phosphodiester glycosidase family protein [Luteolibacter pohnpeiensis]MBK1884435.1 phosphodiester glycosidase family protein [Luteolibacter pohnpeiensis]